MSEAASLPDQKDEFWKDAENETYRLGQPVTCERDRHNWKMVKTNQVECEKCRMGFLLPLGGELKNNSVFIHGTKVI